MPVLRRPTPSPRATAVGRTRSAVSCTPSHAATKHSPVERVGWLGSAPVNSKVYIHEFIDIIGQNRARYMHHMTANWGPIGRQERNMLCFGVWGTVGSTGRWPEVVNLWELDGWDGLAANFSHELSASSLQDES